DDPNGKLDRVEWLDDSGALLSNDLDFVHSETVTGCDAQIFTYTFQIYCDDDPTIPSTTNTVEWTVYPVPENVVEVGGCSLEVSDVDCGGTLTINYSDDNGTTWQSSPNASPVDGEVWLWQAFVTGAPDGCNLEGNVTAACNCTPPSTPIAVSPLSFEICTGEIVPAFEVMLNGGDFVQWFDVETGGEAIGQGFTFMATEAGIYYAEVGNDADDCVSERLAFELIINPLDDAGFTYASTNFCLGDIDILSPDFVAVSGGSFAADGGLGIDPTTGAFDLSTVSQTGTFNITYTTPEPCSSSQSIAIEVGNNELVLDAGEDIEICESQEISLAATLEGIAGLEWSMDGLGSFEDPLSLITNFISPDTGQFTLYLTASNDCGDDLQDSLQLTILPSFLLDVEGNRNIFVGETSDLEAIGGENLEFVWFSGGDENSLSCLDCPNPTASPDTTTTYFVTSNEVCADTASITIMVTEIETIRLAVENAFSPNGDGINDEFTVFVNAPVEEYHLMIFNRWGVKVFESQDPTETWNGIYNDEPQPIGVYAYVIRYQFAGQNTKQLSQNVTIIR
ncbi:MAG: gliding motility-associated C-terminal domain-containing protein, partial [Chitinophagales bacterium]